jgi:hypothetical protein
MLSTAEVIKPVRVSVPRKQNALLFSGIHLQTRATKGCMLVLRSASIHVHEAPVRHVCA